MLNILHGADLHLDSPFSSLPRALGQQLRRLQRRLPGRLVDLAQQRGCQLILLAGDIFDGPEAAPETVDALVEALGRFPGPVFIAPGNHDCCTPGGLWDRTLWPENVHIFTGPTSSVVLGALGCRIWGGAFREPECFDGLPAAPRESLLQIGVFHGDPLSPGPYRYLSPEALDACGLDYLALGHIHQPLLPRRRGRTWYGWPGVTMGRGFDECGPHGVLITQLDGRGCRSELCPLGEVRFETMEVPWGQEPVLPPDARQILCRMTLTGERPRQEVYFPKQGQKQEVHFLSNNPEQEAHFLKSQPQQEAHFLSNNPEQEVHFLNQDQQQEVHFLNQDPQQEAHFLSKNQEQEVHFLIQDQKQEVRFLSIEDFRRKQEVHFLYLEVRDATTAPRQLWSACGDGTLRGLALDRLRQWDGDRDLAARYLLAALEGGDEPCV